MNAGIDIPSHPSTATLEADARWQLLQQVLDSALFAKAPRMCRLLSFLMMRKLSGMEASINERAIGIEVFRRDARDFDTGIDPIVRVQMGRLRNRLARYNAAGSTTAGQQIEIPVGSYVPEVKARGVETAAQLPAISLAPLRTLASCSQSRQFTEGLEEELALQLFRCFGSGHCAAARYRLETSVRIEQWRVRASMRLIDVGVGQTVWMHQRDSEGDLAIAMQEALARAICADLLSHVEGGSQYTGLPPCRGPSPAPVDFATASPEASGTGVP